MIRMFFLCLCVTLFLSACLPPNLEKYRKPQDAVSQSSRDDDVLSSPIVADGPTPQAKTYGAPVQATIYALDKQTFRFKIKDDEVWDSAMNVLLKNYHPTIADKSAGLITTDWDTYYLKNGVFRNKVSLRIRKTAHDAIELTIHNSVEKLQDGSVNTMVGGIWLPVDEGSEEVVRIIQNMALALNQPPPVFPPDMVAKKDQDGDKVESAR